MGVSQNRFRMTFAGYDREAVDRHLTDLEEQNRAMATDRALQQRRAEKLEAELAGLREAHTALRHKFDRVCRTPIESDGLSERMLRMVDLAQVEAADIVQDARGRAERTRGAADDEARRLRRRYERVLGELDDRRTQLEAEFAERTRRTQAEAEERERLAEEKRRSLDEASARRRQRAEQELGKALAARRNESERQARRREEEAADRAAAALAQAREHAADVVARAGARVAELADVQRTLSARLQETREILSAVGELTDPVDAESAAEVSEPSGDAVPAPRDGDDVRVGRARDGDDRDVPVAWPPVVVGAGRDAEPPADRNREAGSREALSAGDAAAVGAEGARGPAASAAHRDPANAPASAGVR